MGAEHGHGWYFPELEGPDLSVELYPGEHKFWDSLPHTSINEIFGDYRDPDDVEGESNPGEEPSGQQ